MSRKHILQIFRAALEAADPEHAVRSHVSFDGRVLTIGRKRYSLGKFDRVHVVGAGKASAAMARGLEQLLGRRISGGLINVPDGNPITLRRIELNPASHPVPDHRGESGSLRIAGIARAAGDRDLLLCVISGGASALMPAPVPQLSLEAKQQLTRRLLNAGATIGELNTVRKHLSYLKGGQLAALAYPATVACLILSDVVGDDLAVIGSGPTVPDPSTISAAHRVLRKYDLNATGDAFRETPKPGDPIFRNVQNLIVGSNRLAIAAAASKARDLGYHPLVLSTTIQGETRDIASMHAEIAREILAAGRPARRPACLLSGGETTVAVRGSGLGGRNQEFALAAGLALEDTPGVTVFSAGTDGIDGPTPAAGALADAGLFARARESGMDARQYLDNNDSYTFFAHLNGLVMTGPTGTNVMDIRLLLIE